MAAEQALDRHGRRTLARAFAPKVLHDIAEFGRSSFLSELLTSSPFAAPLPRHRTLSELYEAIYELLRRGSRPEYVYRNAIITKRLIARHSVAATPLLTEFRVGPRKADLLILNGTSTAYEIKSDFDNFDRLPGQIEHYLKAFDKVYLVTGAEFLHKAQRLLPPSAGIIELTDRYTLRNHREPTANAENIEPSVLFDSLRKAEYSQIIREAFGKLPDTSNMHIHAACKQLFCGLPNATCHDLAFSAIRRHRKAPSHYGDFMHQVPHCLRSALLTSQLDESQIMRLSNALTHHYRH